MTLVVTEISVMTMMIAVMSMVSLMSIVSSMVSKITSMSSSFGCSPDPPFGQLLLLLSAPPQAQIILLFFCYFFILDHLLIDDISRIVGDESIFDIQVSFFKFAIKILQINLKAFSLEGLGKA